MSKNNPIKSVVLCLSCLLAGCFSPGQQVKKLTLRDVDVSNPEVVGEEAYVKSKSREEIKKAYYDYINSAANRDKMRVAAVNRIAQLELDMDKSLEDNSEPGLENDKEEQLYFSTVKSTIDLLNQALSDFPDAPGNDQTLYQLAKAYNQVGNYEGSIGALIQLAEKYRKSPYYVEAQFRVAEDAFLNGFYLRAEEGYTAVINSVESKQFFEKSLFKRGWSRFKQELYFEALDDFYMALEFHKFPHESQMEGTELEQYQEYFRAVGLAFSYMGGTDAIGEYFVGVEDSEHVFKTYSIVSEIMLKQDRVSDAVDVYRLYLKNWPQSDNKLAAYLRIVEIWKSAKYFNRYVEAFEEFYQRFNPRSSEWSQSQKTEDAHTQAVKVIRDNVVLLAGHFHNQFSKTQSNTDREAAMKWYQRYLTDYKEYARQDKVFQLYAELLMTTGAKKEAFDLYEQAAFDGDLILDKESVYASIVIADQLSRAGDGASQMFFDKQLRFSQLFAQLYPQDKRTESLVKNGVEKAFKRKHFSEAVALANALPDSASESVVRDIALLKAQAYFDLAQFEDAEVLYQDMLVAKNLPSKLRRELFDKLAVTIYQQGEKLKSESPVAAAEQFVRIHQVAPSSELAATGMYDAIAVYMQAKRWPEAIHYLKTFQQLYPKHRYAADVTKKLSVAYLSSDRNLEAAKEFESLAKAAGSDEEKRAALWQAAKLYESKNDQSAAIRAYRDYAHNHKRPLPQNMEAMYRLTELYSAAGEPSKREFWLLKINASDRKASASAKTDRTKYLASYAAFELARTRLAQFNKVKLVNPIKKNLKQKKSVMQDAVKYFGQASAYGQAEFLTESAHAIGQIYQDFSVALIESERPKGLTPEQLEQYDILIEDQAFPFEDKAIEFYEANILRIRDGIYDDWVKNSLTQLETLFPARYGRHGKLEKVAE